MGSLILQLKGFQNQNFLVCLAEVHESSGLPADTQLFPIQRPRFVQDLASQFTL